MDFGIRNYFDEEIMMLLGAHIKGYLEKYT